MAGHHLAKNPQKKQDFLIYCSREISFLLIFQNRHFVSSAEFMPAHHPATHRITSHNRPSKSKATLFPPPRRLLRATPQRAPRPMAPADSPGPSPGATSLPGAPTPPGGARGEALLAPGDVCGRTVHIGTISNAVIAGGSASWTGSLGSQAAPPDLAQLQVIKPRRRTKTCKPWPSKLCWDARRRGACGP